MPILVPHEPGKPLQQGDILRGVTLAVADAAGLVELDTPVFALVLSRNCNANRDPKIVVAKVGPRSLSNDGLADLKTLDEWRRYFAGMRDGHEFPDTFYLGEFEAGSNKRYVAKLDSIHTVRLPADASRQQFIEEHRIFHLSIDFVRDLHSRLLGAFAPLGFDDHEWFSDGDLALVARHGTAEVSQLKALVADLEAQIARDGALDKNLKSLELQLKNRRDTLAKAEELLAPYLAESSRRSSAQ